MTMDTEKVHVDQTAILRGATIKRVGPAQKTVIPNCATIIEGRLASGARQIRWRRRRSAWPVRSAPIAPGLEAEIIALDGDPRKDIPAVRRVAFVMKGGIVYKNAARGAIPVFASVEPISNCRRGPDTEVHR